MEGLEITWKHALSVWWLIGWRTFVGAVVIGAALGFVIGLVLGAAGASVQTIASISSIAGGLVAILWGIVVVRMALRKHYRHFRVVLVAHAPG